MEWDPKWSATETGFRCLLSFPLRPTPSRLPGLPGNSSDNHVSEERGSAELDAWMPRCLQSFSLVHIKTCRIFPCAVLLERWLRAKIPTSVRVEFEGHGRRSFCSNFVPTGSKGRLIKSLTSKPRVSRVSSQASAINCGFRLSKSSRPVDSRPFSEVSGTICGFVSLRPFLPPGIFPPSSKGPDSPQLHVAIVLSR